MYSKHKILCCVASFITLAQAFASGAEIRETVLPAASATGIDYADDRAASGRPAEPSGTESPGPASSDSLFWQGDTLTLQEVAVSTSFSSSKSSPLRLSTVSSEMLRSRAASRTYPELLKSIPGVYATSESGSYGDARLNIRGFKQENIAVLLNGIPISGLTTGGMYWNNWMGLADATYAIQVQKGVGSSMLSDCSVGGSVNIITSTVTDRMTAQAGMYGTGYGTFKGYVSFSTGALPRGWGISVMASYVGGSGYVDRTDVNSWAYMLNVTKQIGKYNTLLFTALGSPEQHEQRSLKLSWDEVSEYGLKYNKNWGYRDGRPYNLNKNNYFKPYFLLQHLHSKGRLSMTNSLYLAIGNGGGRWTETKDSPISSYRTPDGLVDWESAVNANSWTPSLSPGQEMPGLPSQGTAARNILSDYRAGHTQAGAVVTASVDVGKGWKVDAGAHYQYYYTWENEVITDLLGADYWYEDYAAGSLAGMAGRNPVKHVGDRIRTDNGKYINHGTLYASASYSSAKLNANAGVSLFGSSYRRWDKYNYTGADIYSRTVFGAGFSAKGGILYKPGNGHSIYLNGGYYSRLPYFDTFFATGNNEPSKDVRNEKNILGEAGYRFVYGRGGVEATFYAAYWKNRTLMSDPYKPQDEDESRYMITGLDAFHYGVEVEAFHNFTHWLRLSAYASIGDWRWKNDVTATIYDDYTLQPVSRIDVYSDGLPVGDAPQTQVGATLIVRIPGGFSLTADWRFNDRMYADFDPEDRTDPEDRHAAYRIPSYHLVDLMADWQHKFRRGVGLTVFAGVSNLLDTVYIERGTDGAGHDLESFRGFWGFGRSFSFGVRLSVEPGH